MKIFGGDLIANIPDLNKIELALNEIGISLYTSEGNFRELRDVFNDIAEKWKSLSK